MRGALLVCAGAAILVGVPQEAPPINEDEAKVPAYTLPDPLRFERGGRVADAQAWHAQRRPELLRLFETQVYGRSAPAPTAMRFVTRAVDREALGGNAVRKQVSVLFTGSESGPSMDLLLYLPKGGGDAAAGKRPAFLGLNFSGNHAIHPDPGITLSTRWMRDGDEKKVVDNRATEASRGTAASRWPVESILSRGFALVTAYYGDLEPDHPDGWKDGVRAHFRPRSDTALKMPPHATQQDIEALAPDGPEDHRLDSWGAIGAWAWGLSRALDYLETDDDIDAARVAVIGHSRLGKTALWAGAQDQRFALVIANESGEGGAAITRRRFGETIARITTTFPHWFCGMFDYYREREDELPVDFHQLVGLIAPRPVYIASAAEDLWADPHGEFLSAKHAEPVYRLLGTDGLGVDDMPPVDTPVGRTIAYHVRQGAHDLTTYDWEQYLAFASRHLARRPMR